MREGRKKEERMEGRLVGSPHLTDKETENIATSHCTEVRPRQVFMVLAELRTSPLATRVAVTPFTCLLQRFCPVTVPLMF